jgi:hypothetical protein
MKRRPAPGRGPERFLLPLCLLPQLAFAAPTPSEGVVPGRTSSVRVSPAREPAQALPDAFAENDISERDVLMGSILPDLRVFVDLDPADMPRNHVQGQLPAAEVREAVELGIGNWASIMPQMRFRLASSPDSANLVVRFRDYRNHITGGATAEAFTPGRWRPAPVPGASTRGAFDFACGARAPGRFPDGRRCRETDNNILLFQTVGMAFRTVDTLDARMHQEYLEALTDRSDPRKRFYRFLPDPRFRGWPPDRSTCVPGAARGGALPALDLGCPEDSDWAAMPHAAGFGREHGPYDIAELVQHEFGHALLGAHTGEAGCLEKTSEDFYAIDRDPVLREPSAIRRAGPRGVYGYSILFTGNGMDAAWNSRGVFALDAARLAGGVLGRDCRPYPSSWHGYRTSYPKSSRWIVLRGREGGTKYVDDWAYAARLMGWPGAAPGAARAEWFQVGLIPKTEPAQGPSEQPP